MGIISGLLQKPAEEKSSLGVCIPDHAKPNKPKTKISTFPSSFEVEGLYEIRKEVTITGKVLSGSITKSSKLVYHDNRILIKKIMHNGKIVDSLEKGTKGAITITPETYLMVRRGNTLEFE
tara:strand:- start:3100 stop:3462 length:363 start_codon:yes stop_codon:yes gene_type:complete